MADQGVVDANTNTDAQMNNNGELLDETILSLGDHGDAERTIFNSTTNDNDVEVHNEVKEKDDHDDVDALHQQDQTDRDDEKIESMGKAYCFYKPEVIG